MEIKKGQKVYLKPLNNGARYNKEIKESIISKVGSIYFYIDGWTTRFFKNTLIQDGNGYTLNWKVYFSIQEINDENEKKHLIEAIRKIIYTHGEVNLSIDQLREIHNIITTEKQNNCKIKCSNCDEMVEPIGTDGICPACFHDV